MIFTKKNFSKATSALMICSVFIITGCKSEEEKAKAIIAAIKTNNTAQIESFLKDENVAKYKTLTGNTALSEALSRNNFDLVKKLVKKGANVNQNTSSYMPPIFKASTVETASFLIDNGADYKIVSPNYGTAVNWSVRGRNYDLVKFYIDKKVDLSVKRKHTQDTALDMALKKYDDKRIIELLRSHNAPTSFSNKFDKDLYEKLDNAVTWKKTEDAVKLLDQGTEFDYELFYKAVKKGNEKVVALFISKKNMIDRQVLGQALRSSPKLANLLLDNAKGLNEKDSTLGLTLLHSTVVSNNLETMKLLIQKGADRTVTIDGRDGKQYDVLEYAMKRKRTAMVNYLKGL